MQVLSLKNQKVYYGGTLQKLPSDETKEFLFFILSKKAPFCQSRKQQCENVSCVVAFLQVLSLKNQKVYYGGTFCRLQRQTE